MLDSFRSCRYPRMRAGGRLLGIILRPEVSHMRSKIFASISVLVILAFAFPSFAETVKGTVLLKNGLMEFKNVSVVDTYSDGYMTYWVGQTQRGGEKLLYDPYNGIWVPGPLSWEPATLPFGHSTVDGWQRRFGNGSIDTRFFFGENGHVYWRFDKFKKRTMQNNRRKSYRAYSFWLDLDTGYRGPAYRIVNGQAIPLAQAPQWDHELNIPLEPPPTEIELDQEAKDALAEASFPTWEETKEEAPEIKQGPLTEEEQISLGDLIKKVTEDGGGK